MEAGPIPALGSSTSVGLGSFLGQHPWPRTERVGQGQSCFSNCRWSRDPLFCLEDIQVPRLGLQKLQGLQAPLNTPLGRAGFRTWTDSPSASPNSRFPRKAPSAQAHVPLLPACSLPESWEHVPRGKPRTPPPPTLTQEKPMQPMAPHSMSASIAGYELAVGK